MSAYTAPIIKIGLVAPFVFLAVMLGIGAFALSKINAEREAREKKYAAYTERIQNAKILEEKLKPGRVQQRELAILLKEEIKPFMAKQLSQSMKRYVDKEYELQQISIKHTEDRGTIGSFVDSDLSRVQMVFRGGYGPMQETLLDLESEFPQLQMEKMVIARTKNFGADQRQALTFNVDYIAWKK